MDKINLYYWAGHKNFGDVLSPMLIEELSGIPTQLKISKDVIFNTKKALKAFLKFDTNTMKTIEMPWERTIYAVGSIIKNGNKRSLIWGSGFMNDHESFGGGTVYAVRGKFTDERLENLGQKKCNVYGDPALLLPLWIKGETNKKHKLGIIPHWLEADKFIDEFSTSKVIDLRTDDIHGVIKDITSCEYILSTSLHGVIVAHAYGIPALWIQEGYIETDGFKFRDYFSSVNIPLYEGIKNFADQIREDTWINLFNENPTKTIINVSLHDIQKKLLKAAPFPLKAQYKILADE
ncbi:MAG: polysaccharide pyruvyl transferase family protein [Dysgonomonas sp.]|uniref:polysaccharide pyruvyl transferase family protein n=1 Tax=Dysgonomonas sp. TaxID=1891233 RepID=UPI0039E56B94